MSLRCQPRFGGEFSRPRLSQIWRAVHRFPRAESPEGGRESRPCLRRPARCFVRERIDAAAVAANVTGKQRQIDERDDIVHRVVMLGDAQRPAKLRAVSLGIGLCAILRIAAAGTPVSRSARSSVYFSTCAL